jgi:succinate-acetate transporter protein
MLILLLSIIFFWLGFALAINRETSDNRGLGIILLILGIFGTIMSMIMIVKIRRLSKKNSYEEYPPQQV